jgi:lipopolysaccharide export system ATP-binding protein
LAQRAPTDKAPSDETGLVLDGVFYRSGRHAILNGCYLEVQPGTVCGLFGRNGSGKTTLLKIASGQVQATSGIAKIDGTRFHRPSRRARFAAIAYLPQDAMLPGDVALRRVFQAAGLQQTAQDDSRLAPLLNRRVDTLSGGERRYAEVVLVLGLDRRYILLDEPFTGVAPRIANHMQHRIDEAAKAGAGVLLTDHDHRRTIPLVDEAYLMWQKQCYRLDDPESIRTQLQKAGYLRS